MTTPVEVKVETPTRAQGPASRRFGFGVLALVLFALALRTVTMEQTYPVEILGDEVYYASVAASIARDQGHRHAQSGTVAWRPPLHAFTLSFLVDPQITLGPRTLLMVTKPLIRLQILWGALLVGITALLARALFDERTGLTAGGIAALYPPLVAHSHYLWSEMLFASLLGAALVLVVRAQARPGTALAVAAGLVFGTAVLAREIAGLVAVVGALWLWRAAPGPERRQALGRGALMLVCMLLVVAPWTVRNYQRLGDFVPVSTIGWFAAAEGNTLDHPTWLASIGPEGFAFRQQYFSVQGEMERVAFARAWLLERVAAEQPTWIFKKLVRGTAQLFSPESYLLYKLARGAYGEVSMSAARTTLIFSVAIYLVLISAAVLGVVSARREHRRSLACAILGVVLAVHVLANSGPRFRVPLMPLLIAYASYALLDLRARLGGLGLRERVALGLTLAVFFGLCVPYYWSDAAALWTSGSRAIPR